VRRFYEEIDKGNIDVFDEVVAEDTWITITNQIAEGDKVVTRLTSIGKHEGDLPGAPKTGNALRMTSITIHRIANGKLAEKWSEKDSMGFLQQIGKVSGLSKQG